MKMGKCLTAAALAVATLFAGSSGEAQDVVMRDSLAYRTNRPAALLFELPGGQIGWTPGQNWLTFRFDWYRPSSTTPLASPPTNWRGRVPKAMPETPKPARTILPDKKAEPARRSPIGLAERR